MENREGIFDPDFGDRIAAMVEAEVARGLEGLDIEAMVHAEIDKAMHKIEHKVAKAKHRVQERARRAAERAVQHAERQARRVNVTIDMEDEGRDAAPKVSEEEQLAILRMLQEGSITTEQAEMLLSALAA